MKKAEVTSQTTYQPIPFPLVIGVTGHRKLTNEPELAQRVNEAISQIRKMLPPLPTTPVVLGVLSPLAEGADRLVARQVLGVRGSDLEVVLPFQREDYVKDFETKESRAEFERLLSEARRVRQLEPRKTRNESYEQVGHYIVDRCDALIALWNGQPSSGQGGTADIVQYARDKKCPLFWINTNDGFTLTFEPGAGLSQLPLADIEGYNSLPVDDDELEARKAREQVHLLGLAEKTHLRSEWLRAICGHFLPHYIRADFLAMRYQTLYFRAGSWVYVLAAAAVSTAAFQALFAPEMPRIVFIEVALMAAVLTIIWLGRRQRWHARWIDYRFLAERFRSAVFLAVANLEVGPLPPSRDLSHSSKDWIVAAFASVWRQVPQRQPEGGAQLDQLKDFFVGAWIEDQINYHRKTASHQERLHHRLAIVGIILFGLTFIAAVLHAFHFGPRELHTLLSFMAVSLPAIGGALGAIRTHREYLRNAERSAEMVRHLEDIKWKMTRAGDLESFLQLVRETEETMLHENEDWRVAVRFHGLEPPA